MSEPADNPIQHKFISLDQLQITSLNTEDTSLRNVDKQLDEGLQQVSKLYITESYIPNLRILGSNIRNLTVLNIPHCGVKNLDGLSICQNIKEIYLPFNDVQTIANIMFLVNLRVIDFESNSISDLKELDYLSILTNLKQVSFLDNPVSHKHGHSSYMENIEKNVPDLETLDDPQQNLKLKFEIEGQTDLAQNNPRNIPVNINFNSIISGRDKKVPNVARPQTAIGIRNSKAGISALNNQSNYSGYSQLTTGEIMVGSAARSLKSREKSRINKNDFSPSKIVASTNTDDLGYIRPKIEECQRPSTSYNTRNANNDPKSQIVRQIADCEDETDALLRELQDWRRQHEHTFEKIKHSSPQPSKVRPLPPTDTLGENVDILRVHDRPHSTIAPPKTPENGDHESSSNSSTNKKGIQKARMRQFQRRAAQHQRESNRRNTSRDSSRSAGGNSSGKNSRNESRTSTPGQIEGIDRTLLNHHGAKQKNQKMVVNK